MSGIDPSLPTQNLPYLEQLKFSTDSDTGEVIVRTSAKGSFSPVGLSTAGKITIVEINSSSWTPLPNTPLINRNALSIQNKSGSQIVINYDNSTVGYVGIEIENGEERFYAIRDSIVIYAKSQSLTVNIICEELS